MFRTTAAFLVLLAPLALGCGDDERSSDDDSQGDGGSAGAGGTTPEPPGGDVLSVTVVNGTFGPLQAVGSTDGVVIATESYGGSINAQTLANVPGVFLARIDEQGEPNRVWQWERQTDYSVSFARLWPINDGSVVIGCSVTSLSGAFYRPVSDAVATPVSVQEPCFARVTGAGTLVAAGELPAPPTWNNKPTGTDSFVLDETGGAIVLINGPDPDSGDPEVQNIVLARYDAAGALLGTAFYGSGQDELSAHDLVAAEDGARFWGVYEGSPDLGTGPLPAPGGSFIARTDGSLTIVEVTRVGGRIASMARVEDGSIYLLVDRNPDPIAANWVVQKHDAAHALLWEEPIELGSNAKIADDGKSGIHFAAGGTERLSFGRMSSDGEIVWRKDIPGLWHTPGELGHDAAGALLLTFQFHDTVDVGTGPVTEDAVNGSAMLLRVTR